MKFTVLLLINVALVVFFIFLLRKPGLLTTYLRDVSGSLGSEWA